MRTTTVLSSDELASLARLGQTIRLARLRRNLTQAAFAERMGVGRPSVVAIGILLKALTVLGYTERLGEIVAADPIGDDMDAVLGRRRSRRSAHVADF